MVATVNADVDFCLLVLIGQVAVVIAFDVLEVDCPDDAALLMVVTVVDVMVETIVVFVTGRVNAH